MNLGEIMKRERVKQGLSQQRLAELAGVTDRAISLWETGKREMRVDSADKVFKALGVSVVIGGENGEDRAAT